MNHMTRRAVLAIAVPMLATVGIASSVSVASAAEATTVVPVAIIPCEGVAPVCNPPVDIPVSTGGVLRATVALDAASCAGITALLSVDDVQAASAPATPGGTTGELELGPVTAGSHVLTVEAEVPFLSTCDVRGWSGTVSVVTSDVVAGQTAAVGPGGSATVAAFTSAVPGAAGIRATLHRSAAATGTASISVLTYDTRPSAIPTGPPISPVAYLDLQLANADPADTIEGVFLPPSPIFPTDPMLPPSPIFPNDPVLPPNPIRLAWWTGEAWAAVYGSGGAVASYSATGQFTVTFDATSSPAVTALGGTVFAIVPNHLVRAFGTPVDTGVRNVAKAGRAIPLRWQVFDAFAAPVTTLDAAVVRVTSVATSCSGGPAVTDEVEAYATGGSGLQSLGDGVYQLNWATAKAFAGTCRQLRLDLGERNPDGTPYFRTAEFEFTR